MDSSATSHFLNNLNIPKLCDDSVKKLEEPISHIEITKAISSMQSNKCPGPDGFPSEFFKKFSQSLLPLLCSVLLEFCKLGQLPQSFSEAYITLIAKKGKNPTNCASYRPISLLNTDAKILAKVLAHRLENLLPTIIYKDHTGLIKNRQFFYNIRRLFDIVYTAREDRPECVVSIDAEKAFDRVEWPYLFAVLNKFGFGPSFISWIKLLYSHPTAMICTNSQFPINDK